MSPGRLFANAGLPLFLLGLMLAGLVGRLAWVQLARQAAYEREVDRAVLHRVRVAAPRGRILDVAGMPLADNESSVRLIADPKELAKAERNKAATLLARGSSSGDAASIAARLRAELVGELAAALRRTAGAARGSDRDRARDLAARLAREGGESRFVVLANDVSPEEEDAIRAILPRFRTGGALRFEERYDRMYPAGAAASGVVGFLGARDHADAGAGGIERAFDEALSGQPGRDASVRAPRAAGGYLDLEEDSPPERGADVHLTIDTTIASIVHEELVDAAAASGAPWLAAVVLEARTGRVLAVTSVPAFDPNARSSGKVSPLVNQAVVTPYEPGSSIKPFTVAAALEAGALREDDRFPIHGGTWFLAGRAKPIRDSHFDPAHNSMDVEEILRRSSNVGAVAIGHRAGPQAIASAFRRYGFAERCGVELPGEGRCTLPTRGTRGSTWDVPNTLSSVSFGYQLMVTPLRLAAGYAMLANGGMRVEPRVVDAVVHADGRVERRGPPPPVRALDAAVAARVREMLLGVVNEEGGTAFSRAKPLRAEFPELDGIAGKTGTAVIHKRPDRLNGTFACFGPSPSPELVVVVMAHDPPRVRFGGDVCAAPGMRILARSLRALGIQPSGPRRIDLAAKGNPRVLAPLETEAPSASLAQAAPPREVR